MCAVCSLPTNHEAERLIIMRYLDPGSGYVFGPSGGAILAFVGSFLASIAYFFRSHLNQFWKNKLFWLLLALIFTAIAIMMAPNMSKNKPLTTVKNKVIVLGFDGVDPKILEEGFKRNLYPNLKKLKETGSYSPLSTTTPPQSPVAWASFATATNPSKHKIYDFIERDPANYSLELAIGNQNQVKLQAKPFWDYTSANNIPSTILFLPNTFPPSKLNGEMVSGMGVPDVTGTQGTSTFFTTKTFQPDPNRRTKFKKIEVVNNKIITEIDGPKYAFVSSTKVATVPFEINLNADPKAVDILVQGQTIRLKEGDYSDWVRIKFNYNLVNNVFGIARFYLKEAGENLDLYLTPVNFDPANPLYAISTPTTFSQDLAQNQLYSTLGLPHDTWALEDGALDEEAFLTQADSIINERERIYWQELENSPKGLFFAYFGFTDTISHVFWPNRVENDPKYKDTLTKYYQKMDEIVGKTMQNLSNGDTLFVLSDHGFANFDFEMNLNSWLRDSGYLVLKGGNKTSPALYENVDWSQTRAYAAGYNGIFINQKGREAKGEVSSVDKQALEKEIQAKLKEAVNPLTNQKVIKQIYNRDELNIDRNDLKAPDLVVGFFKGTRSSWGNAVGEVEKEVFKKRVAKWSGDHLFDPSEVPGVLLSNHKLTSKNPAIVDVIPTILSEFGLTIPSNLDGKVLK